MKDKLPTVSSSQRIGGDAVRAFYAGHPDAWRPKQLDGDDDFGYDFQIQVEDAGQVRDIFRLQLKGTTQLQLNTAEDHISITIKLSTANYFGRATEPVLLVVCDLSGDPFNPADCPLYYQWVQDDLARIFSDDIEPNQKSVTFHVPVANRLLRTTSLISDLERFRRLSQLGTQLDLVIQEARPTMAALERSESVARLGPALAQKSPALLNALLDDSRASWIEAPRGTLPWHIQESSLAIRRGDIEDAKTHLEVAGSLLTGAKPLEQADYWHTVGRFRAFVLDDAGAAEAFDRAYNESQDVERHVVPWAEAKLRLAFVPGDRLDFSAVLPRLVGSAPAIVSMRARLIAAAGDYEEALDLARRIRGPEGSLTRAIIFTMLGRSESAVLECDAGQAQEGLREETSLAFTVIRARGEYLLATGHSDESGLPMTGPAEVRLDWLNRCWKSLSIATNALQKTGWARNVDLIADIWVSTASMLGLQRGIYPLISEAADARPGLQTLQAGAESIAAQLQEFEAAIRFNGRQQPSPDVALRNIALLHLAGRHRDCATKMIDCQSDIDVSDVGFGYATMLAILSAHRIVRHDLRGKWISTLESDSRLEPYAELTHYLLRIADDSLTRDDALKELCEAFERMGRPYEIAAQLLLELDVSDPEQARKCLEVADVVRNRQLIDIQLYVHIAQALITLKDWPRLLELSDELDARFPASDKPRVIGAVALDKMGRSSEARDRLREVVDAPEPDPLALNTYIAIMSRSGFTDEAISTIEQIYGAEKRPEMRLRWLRHLFVVLQLACPEDPRLLDVAWEIGRLAKPENEEEEGLFLMTVFAATLAESVPLESMKRSEFQNRLERFIERFPSSKVLRRVQFPTEFTAQQLMDCLREVTGTTQEQVLWRRRAEEELNKGLIPIPFAWRPKNILDWVPDVPTLWQIGKTSRWQDRALHLSMTFDNWKPFDWSGTRATPLLDLVALFVLQDLGLLEHAFTVLGRIAITKGTFIQLQQMRSPLGGSPFREKIVDLLTQLKTHFSQIDQPGIESYEDGQELTERDSTNEIAKLARAPGYILYSDDAFFRLYASEGDESVRSLCTLDLLYKLDMLEILTAQEVARLIATLASWRVAVEVTNRYQMAIVPPEIVDAKTASDGIDVLSADTLCMAIFNGIWDIRKPYLTLQGQAGALLYELASQMLQSESLLKSLLGLWLMKVRLHRDAPSSAQRIGARLIIQALHNRVVTNPTIIRRIWGTFHALVELAVGDYMDTSIYKDSIRLLAATAAEHDMGLPAETGASTYNMLALGLVAGTSEADIFGVAYSEALIQAATKNQ
ncbi:MAG: DUF4365 domain-containing protein [Gammaproteobacteria bacterium]|nr:DUF4365 domain-containing protein [Gammaproteobacteria bacterium]MBI5615113.1 DUF4365 domain-containing protein [Gammaproteobacteria bacterium]